MTMPMPVYVRAFAEDALLAEMTRRLLAEFGGKYALVGGIFNAGGKAAFNARIIKWNQAAKNLSAQGVNCILAMRDLDALAPPQSNRHCPDSQLKRLLGGAARHDNFLLRFAVAEAENWLLADYHNLCRSFAAAPQRDAGADDILDGKQAVINIAARSRNRQLRESASAVKPRYVYHDRVAEFARQKWNVREAAKNSKSLRQTLARLEAFPNPSR